MKLLKHPTRLTLLVSVFLLSSVIAISTASASPLTNGDFSSGLSSWNTTATGIIATATQEALLIDADYPVQLYQGFDLPALDSTLEFDFLDSLAFFDFQQDPFAFQDTMFATLYLTNDLGTFDINAPVGSSIALLDADHTGPYNSAGILSPSATKPNWIHFSLNLTTADLAGFSFGVIAFELFDFNFIASDSSFLVDNVMVSEVPEPATLSLLGLGALFGARHRRKRKLT